MRLFPSNYLHPLFVHISKPDTNTQGVFRLYSSLTSASVNGRQINLQKNDFTIQYLVYF